MTVRSSASGPQGPRAVALELAKAALQAVDPEVAVRTQLQRPTATELRAGGVRYDLSGGGQLRVVGAGKASPAMARAVEALLGDRLHSGLVIAKAGQVRPPLPRRIEVLEAGHPVPDQAGVEASQRLLTLLDGLGERDLLIVLLSGGGSALLSLPAPGLQLSDLQETSRLLLGAGATIEEMNAVRKHLSALTGGQLAARAAPARVLSLILSDVVGSPLDAIASGPTAADPSSFQQALQILDRYALRPPPTVRAALEEGARGQRPETPKPGAPLFARVQNQLVGSNETAALAACERARALGLNTLLLTTYLQGEAREVGRVLAALLRELGRHDRPCQRPACLVLGGETTVTLGEPCGKGGRNQELALAAALELAGLPEGVALLSLATDGNDGPTDAAGALVDGGTLTRGRAAGLDGQLHLAHHDAYPFLEASGDLLRLGPTGTNVGDLCFLIAL